MPLDDVETRERLDAELQTAELEVFSLAAQAGVDPDDMDEATLEALRERSRAWRAGAALRSVSSELRRARAEAEEIREALYKQLSAAGHAPSGGQADYAALAAGVDAWDRSQQ